MGNYNFGLHKTAKIYQHEITLAAGARGVETAGGNVLSYTNPRLQNQSVDVYDQDGQNLSKTRSAIDPALFIASFDKNTGKITFNDPLQAGDEISLNTSARHL